MSEHVEFDHAIYDTFTYQKGGALSVEEEQLKTLLRSADTALDRKQGYFFEVLGDRFVFGFENRRDDEHSRGGTTAFFDLYATTVDDARSVAFGDLHDFLIDRRITSFTVDIDPTVTYRPRRGPPSSAGDGSQPSDAPSNDDWFRSDRRETSSSGADEDDWFGSDDRSRTADDDDDDGWSNAGGTDAESPERAVDDGPADADAGANEVPFQTLADIWEHRRSTDGEPVRVTLREIETIVDTIDGALSELSFVSEERRDPSYFDFVEGEGRELLAYDDLTERLRSLNEDGNLDWERLPSYQDELEGIQSRAGERIAEDSRERTERKADEAFETARNEFNDALDRHLEEVQEGFSEAVQGTLEPNDDADRDLLGPVSRFGSVFSGDSGQDRSETDAYVKRVRNRLHGGEDAEELTVDEETERLLVDHVVRTVTDGLQEAVENEVEEALTDELTKVIEDEAVELAADAVDRANEVFTARSYERAGETDISESSER